MFAEPLLQNPSFNTNYIFAYIVRQQ